MAETPRKRIIGTPGKLKQTPTNPYAKRYRSPSSISVTPQTPQSQTPIRSSTRRASKRIDLVNGHESNCLIDGPAEESIQELKLVRRRERVPRKSMVDFSEEHGGKLTKPWNLRTPKKKDASDGEISFSLASPDQPETRKRKRRNVPTRRSLEPIAAKSSMREAKRSNNRAAKKRVYYKKVLFDGVEFQVGDDVYVKRREDESSDNEDPETEECRICFKSGNRVMIECDDCLGGFHLKCMKPPLKDVPEGDWICGFCEAKKLGETVELPKPPEGKKLKRTLREKLLSGDLWAARIERLWKEADDVYWIRARWYIIPEETSAGRQPHNLKRELYMTNDYADIEMECILRHCFVKSPKEFARASNDGDDIFLCEYEYDVHWHSFKRLAENNDDEEGDGGSESDQDWNSSKDVESDAEEEIEFEDEETARNSQTRTSATRARAANSRKGRFSGLEKVGTKRIPEHVRCHKQTELERAKATLLLATLPKSLPCRNREMEEISSFIKGSISDDQCLGRCMYIHGVPGTGKTISVLSVMKNLKAEVEAGSIRPYCFVEINGLKLASPENIYSVIYEALSGHRVNWKKALHSLNERFSEGKRIGKEDGKPCILLIDELDLLVTRNQSVLYNILDWPTKPNSNLVVLGIANTMDLPEKLLPRISSRMGIQRLCFGPYNYHQLQEIISTRLKGIDAFEKQAIEFASRKVAAISGDARRALEICRRAAEITDYRIMNGSACPKSGGKILVSMAEVEAAIQEMFQAPHIQVMKSSSKLSKIFLTAMVRELYKTGMAETTFDKVAMTVSSLCSANGEAFPGWDTLLKVGCDLGECRIILCEPGARHSLQKLQLNFPSDDVAFALKDNKDLPWLSQHL
ncbi:PREDICTED: origin of replication complex subunit 1B-like [Tarenaya hassleriana]|uniref:origin of replication complex subunit 1B-like n=1 Tax=Tarenaya hassleriana TaxID=28532 RepID=UPI00053C5C15|nr:PREDICTED: origin of replication complex subunit 1B-like [Tarenaya hassleriana]